ncbi:MAG: TIM barrel protein [Planctomycetes bacterium]|nr:TIM barrel protein [Planctomycetota bacterium]
MSTLNRRDFLAGAGLAAGALAGLPASAAPSPKPAALKFKLGMVTYNIAAAWDLPTLLDVCRKVGLAAVEFRTTHKHGVEPSLNKEQRRDVRKRCADAGVLISGCGSVCEFHSPLKSIVKKNVETCKEFVELVADIGGRGVKVRPNGLPPGVPEEKTLAQIGKALVLCGKAAADAGVEIQVEVHGRGTAEPSRMKTIMEQCGHPAVGVTWNSNPEDVKDGSVAASFRMLWPWVRNCHINQLYKDTTGEYPYRELFRLLRENGYERFTLIELGKAMPDVDSGTELLRYYKALWTEQCR